MTKYFLQPFCHFSLTLEKTFHKPSGWMWPWPLTSKIVRNHAKLIFQWLKCKNRVLTNQIGYFYLIITYYHSLYGGHVPLFTCIQKPRSVGEKNLLEDRPDNGGRTVRAPRSLTHGTTSCDNKRNQTLWATAECIQTCRAVLRCQINHKHLYIWIQSSFYEIYPSTAAGIKTEAKQ